MELEAEILSEHSKRNTVRIARWIGSDRRRFKQLMELFLNGEHRVTQRSAWIVSECFDHAPELITPWLPVMLKKMQEPGVHDAVKRNIVRILQFADVPRSILGVVVSLCFEYINSPDTPIAVKANAMTVVLNATEREPGLLHELKASLQLLQQSPVPAICARTRMVMKEVERREKRSLAPPARAKKEALPRNASKRIPIPKHRP
jgi:hypothetical protein